jgi:hypothetical protein
MAPLPPGGKLLTGFRPQAKDATTNTALDYFSQKPAKIFRTSDGMRHKLPDKFGLH